MLEARMRLPTPARMLVIAEDGSTLQMPDSDVPVDLARRGPLRRLVAALGRKRVDAPGEALGLDDLLDAGWPGEHVSHEAAVNRVHVALTTLRKLGLRDVLVTTDRGYLLDPSVPVRLRS